MAMWKATKKGERPLSPYFGCCIRDYVNEPLTGSKLLDLKADLERELRDLFPEPEFKVGPVRVESWARNEVQITTTIGNYELEIPSNAKELELLNSQLRRAMIDLGMTLGI